MAAHAHYSVPESVSQSAWTIIYIDRYFVHNIYIICIYITYRPATTHPLQFIGFYSPVFSIMFKNVVNRLVCNKKLIHSRINTPIIISISILKVAFYFSASVSFNVSFIMTVEQIDLSFSKYHAIYLSVFIIPLHHIR